MLFFSFTLRWSSGVQGWVFICFRAVLLGLLFAIDGSFGLCTGWEDNGACGNADVVSTGRSEGFADMCDLEDCVTLVGSLLCSCCVNSSLSNVGMGGKSLLKLVCKLFDLSLFAETK